MPDPWRACPCRTTAAAGRSTERAGRAPKRTFTQAVICWALAEGLALYGLVLGSVGAESTETSVFFAGAALLLLLTRPRG